MKQVRVFVIAALLLPVWACTTGAPDPWAKADAAQKRQEATTQAAWDEADAKRRAWEAAETKRTNALMASWVGHHQSELILAWGPYSDTKPDGNGGEVLIYVFGYKNRMFYVNDRGIVYYWRWESL